MEQLKLGTLAMTETCERLWWDIRKFGSSERSRAVGVAGRQWRADGRTTSRAATRPATDEGLPSSISLGISRCTPALA